MLGFAVSGLLWMSAIRSQGFTGAPPNSFLIKACACRCRLEMSVTGLRSRLKDVRLTEHFAAATD